MKISNLLESVASKKPVAKWVVRSTNKTPKELLGKTFVADSEQEAIEWNDKKGFQGEITPEDKFGKKIPRKSILNPGSFKVKKTPDENAELGAIIPGGEASWAVVDMKSKDIYAYDFVSKKEAESWISKTKSLEEGLTYKSEKLAINCEVSKDGKASMERFVYNSEDFGDRTDAMNKAKKYFEAKGFKVKSCANGGKAKPSENLTEGK